jgi:hypothetical protein
MTEEPGAGKLACPVLDRGWDERSSYPPEQNSLHGRAADIARQVAHAQTANGSAASAMAINGFLPLASGYRIAPVYRSQVVENA